MIKRNVLRRKLIKNHHISTSDANFELTIENTISTVTFKQQRHLNSTLFLLLPLLLIVLEETSALPPIIRIGKCFTMSVHISEFCYCEHDEHILVYCTYLTKKKLSKDIQRYILRLAKNHRSK